MAESNQQVSGRMKNKCENKVVGIDMNGLDICKKHKKPFELYCKDDESLLCTTCAIVDHRSCKTVVELENIADKSQCETVIANLQKAILKTHQAVGNVKEAKSCLSGDAQRVQHKLSKMRTKFIKMFDDFAEKVTTETNTYRDKTTIAWTKKQVECETKLKSMKTSLRTIDNVASNGTPSQQFIAAHSMRKTLQNKVKNADSLYAELGTLSVSCNFDQHIDTLRSGVVSELKPGVLELKYNLPKKTRLEEIASIDLKKAGDDETQSLYSGLDFLPDGRLVVVDNKNNKCLLYDENLRLLSAYTLPYQYPQCVAVVSDDKVAVTTGGEYRLDFLHVSKSNEITLNRTCKVSVQYDSISMKDEDNLVVSAYNHTPPVRIVSMSGEEKDFDIAFPPKKYPVATSSCTYIRGQDKVVLADRDADEVHIYDVKTGEKVVIQDSLIKQPSGVAVGPCDHVFVGSWSTSSLVEITPAGRVLSSHPVDMHFPVYIAVSKDRKDWQYIIVQ